MEEITKLKKVYQLFAESSTEAMAKDKLPTALKYAGFGVEDTRLTTLMCSVDTEFVSFDVFRRVCESCEQLDVSKGELLDAFKVYDPEGTGFMAVEDFISILRNGREAFDEEEVEEILSLFGPDGEGKICYDLIISRIYGSK